MCFHSLQCQQRLDSFSLQSSALLHNEMLCSSNMRSSPQWRCNCAVFHLLPPDNYGATACSLNIPPSSSILRIWKLQKLKVQYEVANVTVHIYRMSQEEGTKLWESVPYLKIYRYNPKHLYPKLNGYGDNGQRSLKEKGSKHCK